MGIFILIILCLAWYVLYHFLLPVIKPLQLVSNRISRKIHLYYLEKWWVLRWKQKKKYPVIIQYNPPKWINSAEVWFLLHRYASSTDIFSLLYKWQAEWLISISVEKTKNWEKIKIKKWKIFDMIVRHMKIYFLVNCFWNQRWGNLLVFQILVHYVIRKCWRSIELLNDGFNRRKLGILSKMSWFIIKKSGELFFLFWLWL